MNSFYANIPGELQQYSQWVCWNYVEGDNGKKTKVPINPIQRKYARKDDPSTWCTFEDVVAHSFAYDGIGFIFTHDDPFIFIDFDDSEDPQIIANQKFYFQQFNSYSERSPSGKGLHIIVRGKLESGRRRNKIEVYPYSFATMTGDVFHQAEIRDCQELVSHLWESLGGVDDNREFDNHHVVSELTDEDVFNMAASAKNGQKFTDLWNGDIHTYHRGDHSAADFAFVDIVAFYTQDRGQIIRLFRASSLGQRDKAKRADYVQKMVSKAFDNIVPRVDFTQLISNMEIITPDDQIVEATTEITRTDVATLVQPTLIQPVIKSERLENKAAEAYDGPPGLTGEIAKFIFQQAWKPVHEISVLGALGLMAGIAGRGYNCSGSGLNLYLLILAKTGRGKEAISKGYEKIFDCVAPMMPTFRDFKGPGDLASGQGLLNYMAQHRTKSFVSVFGEFGPMLKRITSPTAIGADLMTQKVMLDFYSKSGRSGRIDPTAYSDSEKTTQPIDSPAFSFIAESAPKWFDILANEGMIETGLLPRFIIAEYNGIRVASNEKGPLMYPTQDLVNKITAVATSSLNNMQAGVPLNIGFTDEAKEKSVALDRECDHTINEAKDDTLAELWNRVHLNTIKIAAIVAVGCNPVNPKIDCLSWDWAEMFVRYNMDKLQAKFEDGGAILMAGSGAETAEVQKIEDSIVEFLVRPHNELESYQVSKALHQCRVIPWGYFSRKLVQIKPFKGAKVGAVNAIKRAITNLIDNGDLQEISKVQLVKEFDFHGRGFAIRSIRLAEKAKNRKRITTSK